MIESGKLLDILHNYNKFWMTGRIESGVRRDILDACVRQLDSREILLLKGIRRSGKSTLMAQMIGVLLEKSEQPARILRISFEEPLFSAAASIELLENIYRIYRERVYPTGRCYLFLDEIQNIPGWERWVRGRSETEDLKVIITGSSSQLLSREAGTKLTGRHLSFEVYPLSFREFLRFRNVSVRSRADYSGQKPLIRHFFGEYLRYGGFPEVVLKESVEDKELMLRQYFEDILYRDVVSRNEIRDVVTMKNLVVYLLTNTGRLTSISSLKKVFGVSQDKIENYTAAIMETYLIHRLPKFSFSMKKSLRDRFKVYAIDTGLRNRVAFSFSEDSGWLAENVVMNHLKAGGDEVYYAGNGAETDFVVRERQRVTKRIQVWYADPAETVIPERELLGFTAPAIERTGGSAAPADEISPDGVTGESEVIPMLQGSVGDAAETCLNLLITNDLEGIRRVGNTPITCIPLPLFLLNKQEKL